MKTLIVQYYGRDHLTSRKKLIAKSHRFKKTFRGSNFKSDTAAIVGTKCDRSQKWNKSNIRVKVSYEDRIEKSLSQYTKGSILPVCEGHFFNCWDENFFPKSEGELFSRTQWREFLTGLYCAARCRYRYDFYLLAVLEYLEFVGHAALGVRRRYPSALVAHVLGQINVTRLTQRCYLFHKRKFFFNLVLLQKIHFFSSKLGYCDPAFFWLKWCFVLTFNTQSLSLNIKLCTLEIRTGEFSMVEKYSINKDFYFTVKLKNIYQLKNIQSVEWIWRRLFLLKL